MTYVVIDGCILCKYTDCVVVCPVDDCFHEGPNMLVIDPDTCIDCSLCVPECPAEAIMEEFSVPENKQVFVTLNAEYAKQWPGINVQKDPMPDADKWVDVTDKAEYFKP